VTQNKEGSGDGLWRDPVLALMSGPPVRSDDSGKLWARFVHGAKADITVVSDTTAHSTSRPVSDVVAGYADTFGRVSSETRFE
jgi:hypothetical protein